ncbi:MAG: hypothetical protein JWQ27_2505 [Ferruginibacter sp.]|nr:hypothetical protein [Ferruginibacter sp.]
MNNPELIKPTLFALLVGIDDYHNEILLEKEKIIFPKLKSCVADTKKVRDQLFRETGFKLSVKCLFNKEATKQAIAATFQTHLSKATKEDTVVFYFSGHGTHEHADPRLFPSETDGRLEDMVCYFDQQTANDFLLADKELRWLISNLAQHQPHIVLLFDCCHSGDISRNLVDSFNEVTEKRIPYVFPQRAYEHFLFASSISAGTIKEKGLAAALPEGSHFQLSACEANESAVEISGESVFTKTLLKVWQQTTGTISYQQLAARIRQYMRNVYEQKPKLYTPGSAGDLFLPFLNKSGKRGATAVAEATFNESSGWQIDKGALQNLQERQTLQLFDPDHKTKTYPARIEKVYLDHAEIQALDLQKDKVYQCLLTGSPASAIPLYLHFGQAPRQQAKRIIDHLEANASAYLPEDDVARARYGLYWLAGQYYFAQPGDLYRPLTKPVAGSDETAPQVIAEQLQQIANWETLLHIGNKDPRTTISKDEIIVSIAEGMPPVACKPVAHKETIRINYLQDNREWKTGLLISLKNNASASRYCCCLYLFSGFQSFTGFLSPPVYLLEPGNQVFLSVNDNDNIPVTVDPVARWYNWKAQTDRLKVIVSSEPFDAAFLELAAIETAVIPGGNLDRGEGEVFKSLGSAVPPFVTKGWTVIDIDLELVNPFYNKLSASDKTLMLADSNTAPFADGLYMNKNHPSVVSTSSS